MRLSTPLFAGLSLATGLAFSLPAEAHVELASGPAPAAKSQKLTFAVGHGCEGGHDTVRIRVDIPTGVTSVRPMFSDFGKPTVIRNGTTVTAVEWTKSATDELGADDAFYEITLRARIPDAAFTRLQFNVTQTCHTPAGDVVVAWDQAPGATGNPAPMVNVVPARTAGWNKITLARAVAAADLPLYFGDAQIVWRGSAAYSPNAATMEQIGKTTGVTALAGGLASGDELWVKY
jgi:uncharacterized protein YcnI